MTAKIAVLPDEVVHLMAAGEVVDSPAAVVRELVENALDAGATRVIIAVCAEQWWIRVADNGMGMGPADLQAAATPHSTSKIRHSDDLQQIQSLGFRGEALHSLAQLSTLEIASRPQDRNLGRNLDCNLDRNMGWQGRYDAQGTCVDLHPVAIAPGTIVTVHNLFGSWPARRQALPLAQQLRTLQHTIYHSALCHPQVTWQVQQVESRNGTLQERPWFNIGSGQTAQQILPQIVRGVLNSDLQEWSTVPRTTPTGVAPTALSGAGAGGKPSLYLLLGLPDRCHRRRPDWIKVAINGRCVHLPELEQIILAGFRRTLPRDRFPLCFIHLQAPPAQIDWNRHPAKSEIYLQNLDFWRSQVTEAIHGALSQHPSQLPEALYSSRMSTLIKAAEADSGYNTARTISVPESDGLASTTPPSPSSDSGSPTLNPASSLSPHQESWQRLTAIAQVRNTYILAETASGVCLIEQHIAHERVLYEQLCDRWALVSLAMPITLNHLTEAQVEQLQRLGLEVAPFGEAVWVVRSAPAPLADRSDCTEAIRELSQGGDLQTAQVAIACRTAIRNGTPLSQVEMQALLDQWQRTRNPRTCPHGRPICLTLEESSLSRFFRRHWVIGKSHGIQ